MISYYDLLGLIKEGKQPSKVKYGEKIYEWSGSNYKHENEFITNFVDEIDMFKKRIEIIEEKPKQITKIDIPAIDNIENKRIYRAEYKINELIDKINYLLGEDKHE